VRAADRERVRRADLLAGDDVDQGADRQPGGGVLHRLGDIVAGDVDPGTVGEGYEGQSTRLSR